MVNLKDKRVLVIIAAAVLLVAAGVFYGMKFKEKKSSQDVAGKTIEFINQNLLQPGTIASLARIAEESGIYKFTIKVGTAEPDVYVTKNGKLLFVQGVIDMNMSPATTTKNKTSNNATE